MSRTRHAMQTRYKQLRTRPYQRPKYQREIIRNLNYDEAAIRPIDSR
jgi:hypothetical protein